MFIDSSELVQIIKGCKNNKRNAQELLYKNYHSYGLNVCMHYSGDRSEAEDILIEGFYKVFTKIDQFDVKNDFKPWFRKILVNTAIDYYRKHHKIKTYEDLLYVEEESLELTGLDHLNFDDLLALLNKLPTQYRLVFNLYVIEGYSHEEISEKIGIGFSTSKSNLSRAKAALRKSIEINRKSHIANG